MITLNKMGGYNNEEGAEFRCKSSEISNLPTEDVPANSTCFLIDTQEVICYDSDTKTWI